MHQQQVAMLAQQQALYMAAAKAAGGTPNGVSQQAIANALNVASANWSNTGGYQIPGMTNPVGGQADLQKLMQVRSPLFLFYSKINISIDQVLAKFSLILALCYIAIILEHEYERKHEHETRTTAREHSTIPIVQVCTQNCNSFCFF